MNPAFWKNLVPWMLKSLTSVLNVFCHSFHGNYSFLNLKIVTIQIVAAIFQFFTEQSDYCCGNYSREETNQGRNLYEEIKYYKPSCMSIVWNMVLKTSLLTDKINLWHGKIWSSQIIRQSLISSLKHKSSITCPRRKKVEFGLWCKIFVFFSSGSLKTRKKILVLLC